MASSKDIRNRIKGVKSTRQITRAMQMVATSKMKKAQDVAKNGRPYAMLLADVIVSVADEFEEITQEFFEVPAVLAPRLFNMILRQSVELEDSLSKESVFGYW